MKRINKITLGLATLLACGGLVSCGGGNTVTYEAEFSWKGIKATATLTPSDGGEEIVLDAEVERSTTAATCEEDGKTVYTATVEHDGKTYTDSKESVIEKLGHDYGEWVPNGDATHSKTCHNDETHVLTEDCVYKTVITKIPSSTETGYGKIVCGECEEVTAESSLPVLTDSQYEVTQNETSKLYEITLDKNVYSFEINSKELLPSQAQRTYFKAGDSGWKDNGAVRLDTESRVEFSIFSNEDVDVDFYSSLSSRSLVEDEYTFLDIYDVVLNDRYLEASEETGKLLKEEWGKGWLTEANVKVGKIHLNKGLNFITIISKKANLAHLNKISFDYTGNAVITLPNVTKFNAVEAQTIYFDPESQHSGIYGSDKTNYLSKYSDGSNARLNTGDYVEFAFEASEDMKVAIAIDNSFRYELDYDANEVIYDKYKVFLKQSGEDYSEILRTDARAYEQRVYSTKNYGEFHTLRVCELELKAGVAYTLKFQARGNQHLEQMWFASNSNGTIELLAEI